MDHNEGLKAARGITTAVAASLLAWTIVVSVILWLT